ncbi:RidA family protein [Muricomes intestini]|jgi:2-iminobutanoate/2-iminopropanoate deaminase|uniref:RidA family protein n=1 Tax=Muricomes intestini TaxID=1796634 RepID=UPI000EC2CD94|nr:reactive intermediate/imine deaminase [Lachnospiraceae bacterium]
MIHTISTLAAPAAIGPYSQGNQAGHFIFLSGQLPVDMESGAFPESVEEQTEKSLTNIRSILESSGCTMDNVIKTTVFLSDMNNFGAMNGVYEKFFSKNAYPSRSAVEVARLPKDALVEIEAIAYID